MVGVWRTLSLVAPKSAPWAWLGGVSDPEVKMDHKFEAPLSVFELQPAGRPPEPSKFWLKNELPVAPPIWNVYVRSRVTPPCSTACSVAVTRPPQLPPTMKLNVSQTVEKAANDPYV